MLPKLPPGFTHPMRIGTGAFASVYRVRQTALDRWVALKFMFEKNAPRRQELLKEARTQAKLHIECVPQIFDAFEWRQSICMVMEWVRGVSLSELLATELPVDDRVRIAGSFIRALSTIHARGFAHRDLKPENVLVAPDHGLYLVDFGFSKNITDQQLSSANVAKGTPAYMAPELWTRGGQVDLMRADVYAAGKMLVQILDGTAYELFPDPLLSTNPQKRPATGEDLAVRWNEECGAVADAADWQRMAGNPAAEQLSGQLLAAARQLRYAHRSEEAYWLLVESIEENGNNGEAVEMMATFQSVPHHRRNVLQYLLFASILTTGVISAYIVGTGRAVHDHYRETTGIDSRMMKLAPLTGTEAPALQVSLREDPLRTDRLSGRLLISSLPSGTRLMVGSRKVSPDSALREGIYLHWGEHTVTLCDSAGRALRSEIVRLLPFQTKVVDIAYAGNATKGQQ